MVIESPNKHHTPPRWPRIIGAAVAIAILIFSVYASFSFATDYRPPKLIDERFDAMIKRGTLIVATDASYAPFAYVRDGRYGGLDVEIAGSLAGRLGLDLEIVNMSSDGLYDAIEVGRVDMAISALSAIPEMQNDFSYSIPYFDAGQVLVVRGDSRIGSAADLEDQTVGVELGSMGDMIARRLQEEDKSIVLSKGYHLPDEALDALVRAEVDAVITDKVSAMSYLKRNEGLKMLGDPMSQEPYVIAMPAKSPKMLGTVNGILSEMLANGELDRLARESF